MEKKMVIIVACLLLIVVSLNMDSVESQQNPDCYDACNTACVGLETRLYLRCDRKCQIRCGPDLQAYEHKG